jgi:hypothetical protein
MIKKITLRKWMTSVPFGRLKKRSKVDYLFDLFLRHRTLLWDMNIIQIKDLKKEFFFFICHSMF